jgi:hypothetical protein
MEQQDFSGLASLARKKAAIMNDLKKLPKDKRNTQQNYGYASAEGVFDTIRALMVEHGLVLFTSAVSGSQEHFTSGKGTPGLHTTVQYRMLWVDTETGATVEDFWLSEGDDYQDKGYSKCATLALKYYLMTTFIVSSGDPKDDPDSGVRSKGQRSDVKPSNNAAATPPRTQTPPQAMSTPKSASEGKQTPSVSNWWQDATEINFVKETLGMTPGKAVAVLKRNFDEFPTADAFVAAVQALSATVQNQAANPQPAAVHIEDPLANDMLDITHVEPKMARGRTAVNQWIGHAMHDGKHPVQILLFAEDRRQLKALGYDVSGWDDVIGQNYPAPITVTTYKDTVGRKLAMAWSAAANALVAIERAR